MNAEINVWNPQVQEQNGFSLAAIDNNGVTPYTIEASTRHGKMGRLGRVELGQSGYGSRVGVANFIHIHEPTHYPLYLDKS